MTAWATSSWPPRSPTSGTSRASPVRLGYLLDLAPKDLERIIYFAAYVVTRIDDERRHKDLPEIETEIEAREARDRAPTATIRVKKRLNELEDRLKELEGEGAKGAQLSAAKREAQRDVERHQRGQRRARPSTSTTSLAAFKGLSVKQLVADDNVYRSLRERFGDYFDGGMGAEAIKRLLHRTTTPRPRPSSSRDDHRERQGHAAPEGDQAPEGRVRTSSRAVRPRSAWCSTPSR